MTEATLGLLIGGALPALLYGIGNVLVKASEREGMGVGPLLLLTGVAVLIVGCMAVVIFPERNITVKSAGYALLFGTVWGLGTLCVAIVLTKFDIPISKLVPLYNTNTLVAVLIALVVFSEWRDLQTTRLLIGAGLIMLGSVLVVRA